MVDQIIDDKIRLFLCMEVVLLGDVGFNHGADALMEICKNLKQIFELLIDSSD